MERARLVPPTPASLPDPLPPPAPPSRASGAVGVEQGGAAAAWRGRLHRRTQQSAQAAQSQAGRAAAAGHASALQQSEASLASAEALLAARLGAVRGARGGARVLGQEAAAGAADQGGTLAQGITDDFDQEEDSDLGSDGFEP